MSTTSGPVPVTAASAAWRNSARRAAVSELHERGDVGHAQPPRGELGRAG